MIRRDSPRIFMGVHEDPSGLTRAMSRRAPWCARFSENLHESPEKIRRDSLTPEVLKRSPLKDPSGLMREPCLVVSREWSR